MGVVADPSGVNVAVFSAHASAIQLCLFDAADRETARINLPERTGDIHHGHVPGILPGQRYGLRALGPHAPREGHRFNAHKLLLDPYAAEIDRPFVLHPSMFGHVSGHHDGHLSFDDTDSAPFMPKAIVQAERAPLAPRQINPWSRTVIYEMHVRGFTKLHPKVPEAVRGCFAGLGHPAPLRHLAELGITAVELLPVAAWLDERHLGPLGLTNYWGYNPVAFGAPDPRLAPGGWAEIAETVARLEAADIETILDVVFNHTGEGDHLGPTVSLRGLDNASYYRLDPADPSRYLNDAGCGNTLALERPAGLQLVMESLRRFAQWGGVHGFRFDLATTLGRRPDGFDPDHPLLAAIQQDPVLGRLKLIAEPWDLGAGGYQLGQFPAGWGEWNDRYRDTARRFWRGDRSLVGDMATRLAGSADLFAERNRPLSRSINYITAHDGFTMADLVSHERKHNQANGEENRDGTDANHSWNHGQEGASDEPDIVAARFRDQCALLATLLLSRGTPMLSMGDELGRSQNGNNNAYAQDNQTSWLDWSSSDPALLAHARALIADRLAHPALHDERPLTGHPIDETGVPDVQWLRTDGRPMEPGDWHDPDKRTLAAALYAVGEAGPSRALVILNAGFEPVEMALPEPRQGFGWTLRGPDGGEAADHARLSPRAVAWLVETPLSRPRGRVGVDAAALDALARAAGIAPDWWEVSGRHHAVTDGTKQALLAAMRLPATTTAEARMSLVRLAEDRDRRALPHVHVAHAGEPIHLDIAPANGRLAMLVIERQDGPAERIPVPPDAGTPLAITGLDGRLRPRRRVTLPPMAMGRARLIFEDQPSQGCELIIAPRSCWRPATLDRPRFGLAAHLYTLRRDGDQGIGDFTTLARLGAEARQAGAVTLGLNPMHAQFAQDRGRASPYHPSDRRFLDPIYLDLASGPFAAAPAVRNLLARHERLFASLSDAAAVDYEAVWEAKREVLAAAFTAMQHAVGSNFAAQQDAFAAFIADGGEELMRFAAFEAIAAQHRGKSWRQWPQALRDGDDAAIAAFAGQRRSEIRFALFQQWLAENAFARAAAEADLPLGFYRDLAVGSAPDGAEAWACQGRLADGVSIGAPPDPFAAEGQVWCLPAPDPLALRQDGYRSLGGLYAANMRHAGALRIDHAMGLSRLFWVPDGASASEGAYVAYDLREQLGVLSLESARARCLVIGEDLGTVPDGFRDAMREAGILSYRVLGLEREGQAFRQPAAYPQAAAACAGTHDLPTLSGWWSGSDIAEAASLGLIAGGTEAARLEREAEKAALWTALQEAGFAPGDEDGTVPPAPLEDEAAAAIHAWLAASPCDLMLVQADDLTGDEARLNLPGTDRERPNWRRKLSLPVETILAGSRAAAILRAVSAVRPADNEAGADGASPDALSSGGT